MEVHDKILRASLDLFFKHGIKRVTMDDIAKELGMSKKTIYQYYKEKDEIVRQLCEIQIIENENRFQKVQLQSVNPVHEIISISLGLRRMMENINPLFFMDLQKYHSKSYDLIQNFKKECAYKDIVRNIEQGKEQGYYRSELDSHFVAIYRLAQMDNLMFGNIFSLDKISLIKANELLFDLFLHSICTEKGLKEIQQYKTNKEQE